MVSSTPLDAFLGYGIVRPLRRDARDFAAAGGKVLVNSAVGQILGTRASTERSQGELKWRPNFGSKLHMLRFRKGAVVDEMARIWTREALATWEPRVNVSDVVTTFNQQTRKRTIKVFSNLIDQNVPGNNVILSDVVTNVEV